MVVVVDVQMAQLAALPDETVNYLAFVAPRLGSDVAMTGPLAALAGGATAPNPSYLANTNGAYAGGGLVRQAGYATDPATADDPSVRAFDGGGLVTEVAPSGVLTSQAATAPVPVQVAQAPTTPRPVAASLPWSGGWGIQVGAFEDPAISRAAIERARSDASDLLVSSQSAIIPVQRGAVLYRARLTGLSASSASAACARLTVDGVDCFTVPPGS